MKYIPVNKATGTKYPPVSEEEKLEMEIHASTRGKYNFVKVEDPKKQPQPSQEATGGDIPPVAGAEKADKKKKA